MADLLAIEMNRGKQKIYAVVHDRPPNRVPSSRMAENVLQRGRRIPGKQVDFSCCTPGSMELRAPGLIERFHDIILGDSAFCRDEHINMMPRNKAFDAVLSTKFVQVPKQKRDHASNFL